LRINGMKATLTKCFAINKLRFNLFLLNIVSISFNALSSRTVLPLEILTEPLKIQLSNLVQILIQSLRDVRLLTHVQICQLLEIYYHLLISRLLPAGPTVLCSPSDQFKNIFMHLNIKPYLIILASVILIFILFGLLRNFVFLKTGCQ